MRDTRKRATLRVARHARPLTNPHPHDARRASYARAKFYVLNYGTQILYLFVSLKLNSGVACTASVVGGMGGVWGGTGSDLAIQAPFPPQEKYTKD